MNTLNKTVPFFIPPLFCNLSLTKNTPREEQSQKGDLSSKVEGLELEIGEGTLSPKVGESCT